MKMTISHAWFLLLLLLPNFESSSSTEKLNGVCVSKGGRFASYKTEGEPPKKDGKGAKGLNLCRIFRRRTCCTSAQTHPALLAVRKLASTGEASEQCLHLWEMLECSICDPNVGVQSGPPRVCASFCHRVYNACSSAYFSSDVKTRVLAPCGVNDFLCARASKWVSNGTELCRAAGFAVDIDDNSIDGTSERFCYGSKASLDSIVESWSSRSEIAERDERLEVLEDMLFWLREMTLSEKVSWAVGGLLFTGGLFFVSKRKSRSRRQKLEAIQSVARKLRQDSRAFPGNRNRGRR